MMYVESKEGLCSLMHQLQTRFNGDNCDWISQNVNNINKEITSITNDIDSLFEEAKTD